MNADFVDGMPVRNTDVDVPLSLIHIFARARVVELPLEGAADPGEAGASGAAGADAAGERSADRRHAGCGPAAAGPSTGEGGR